MATTDRIDPVAAAEFRGLFFGEGHIDMMKNGRASSLTPRVRIAVRDDDRDVVEWCRALFGGSICSTARTRSVEWTITGRNLGPIAEILSGGMIPSKKRGEVLLLVEAVSLVSTRGVNTSDSAKLRQREIRDEMKALRVYRAVA